MSATVWPIGAVNGWHGMEIRQATESDDEAFAAPLGELVDPLFVSPSREGAPAFVASIGLEAIRACLPVVGCVLVRRRDLRRAARRGRRHA